MLGLILEGCSQRIEKVRSGSNTPGQADAAAFDKSRSYGRVWLVSGHSKSVSVPEAWSEVRRR